MFKPKFSFTKPVLIKGEAVSCPHSIHQRSLGGLKPDVNEPVSGRIEPEQIQVLMTATRSVPIASQCQDVGLYYEKVVPNGEFYHPRTVYDYYQMGSEEALVAIDLYEDEDAEEDDKDYRLKPIHSRVASVYNRPYCLVPEEMIEIAPNVTACVAVTPDELESLYVQVYHESGAYSYFQVYSTPDIDYSITLSKPERDLNMTIYKFNGRTWDPKFVQPVILEEPPTDFGTGSEYRTQGLRKNVPGPSELEGVVEFE